MHRVGVIGGGQLAQMLAQAAPALGIDLWVQARDRDEPAVTAATGVVWGDLTNVSATRQLAQHCDLITFENEFVDLAALQPLAEQGVTFWPSLSTLSPLLDKYDQRTFLRNLGIPVPDFQLMTGSLPPWGLPSVWKSRRHGYDGYGTRIVREHEDWQDLSATSPAVVEAFIPFERELAIMAARSRSGEIALYPIVETIQKQQVCRQVIAPAILPTEIAATIQQITTHLLMTLEVVGIVGIEFFLTHGGEVLVNEISPRTHNSGHYTLDACPTSQFEQHLRAIAGLPLGATTLTTPVALMVNLLGYEEAESDYGAVRHQLSALPRTTVHWYGKSQSRPGRKLGHVTMLLPDQAGIPAAIAAIESLWYGVETRLPQ